MANKRELQTFSPLGYKSILLSDDEVKQIIYALEYVAKSETELGNDLKMVLEGSL